MKKVYLIGNAHIDPVWLWRRAEGMSEILSTFRSALDRMNEFPDYVFTSACAAYYQWVEEIDPDMFAEIRQRVKEGRWEIAGGMWVQPDCNLPAGESLARHLLYSQRYFAEKFGETARVGYNVDSFGHNGMLPQLLEKAGIHSYLFMRPSPEETRESDSPALPELFWWKSPDGSRVLTGRVNIGYNDPGYMREGEQAHPSVAKALTLKRKAEETEIPYFSMYGIGNHGGGPTIAALEALEEMLKKEPEIGYARAEALFEDVREQRKELPCHQGDLQHHASGCYAAHSGIKAQHRFAENELLAAERYQNLTALYLREDKIPEKYELKHYWETLLFHEFHDVLAGCCIRSACDEALNAFGNIRHGAADAAMAAATRLSWNVATTRLQDGSPAQKNGWQLWQKKGEGAPVVLVNPHSFELDTHVTINSDVKAVWNAAGEALPCQRVRGEQTNGGDLYNTLVRVKLPAFGYTTCYLWKEGEEAAFAETATGEEYALENQLLRIEFDPATGKITSFYDKKRERDLADKNRPMGGALVLEDAPHDTWAHRVFRFDKVIGSFENARVELLEKGPVRSTVRVTSSYGHSTLVQDYSLLAGSPVLQIKCSLNLQEKHVMVKLCFPASLQEAEAIYSMPYGFLKKKCNGVEEPAQKWMALTDGKTKTGLALLNDCKHSHSAAEGEMRIVIARSTMFADHFGQRDGMETFQDMGEQFFRLGLMPFAESSLEQVVRHAQELAVSPYVVMDTHHGGKLPNHGTGISVSAPNVLCTALKKAEDGDGIVLRLVETGGRPCDTEVRLPQLGAAAALTFQPQEIKTLRIRKDGSISSVLLTEEEETVCACRT